MHVFQPDFPDESPDRCLGHFSYIIVKQVIVNQKSRLFDDVLRVSESSQDDFGHAGADVVVVVERRTVPVTLFCSGFTDIMEQGGETDMQFRGWTSFECTEIVFPDRVDMMEILSDPDSFFEFRNDVVEQAGR